MAKLITSKLNEKEIQVKCSCLQQKIKGNNMVHVHGPTSSVTPNTRIQLYMCTLLEVL